MEKGKKREEIYVTFKQGFILENMLEALNTKDERIKRVALKNMKPVNLNMEDYREDVEFLKIEHATEDSDGNIVRNEKTGTYKMSKANEIAFGKKHKEMLKKTFKMVPTYFPVVSFFLSATPLTLVGLAPLLDDKFEDELFKLQESKRLAEELKADKTRQIPK